MTEPDTNLLRRRDFDERRQIASFSEQALNILSDVLYDADELLALLRTDSTTAQYGWMTGSIQNIYDCVKTTMERLSN